MPILFFHRYRFIALFFFAYLSLSFSPPVSDAASLVIEKQFNEALRLFQGKKDAEAEAIFIKILKQDPTLLRPRQFLGLIYARTQRLDQAIALFRKMVKALPSYGGAMPMMA